MSGLTEYSGGQKAQWRRWLWNRAEERLRKHTAPEACTVVYLPGPSPQKEIDNATRRGFSTTNMVGVEYEKNTFASLRAAKVNAIQGDIWDVVSGWPERRPIDFLHVDLCHGYQRCERMIEVLTSAGPFSPGAVVAVTMLRGRERGLRRFPAEFDQAELKHRGFRLVLDLVKEYSGMAMTTNGLGLDAAIQAVHERLNPVYYSYRSEANRANIMDTVVYSVPSIARVRARQVNRSAAAYVAHMTMRDQRNGGFFAPFSVAHRERSKRIRELSAGR
jgi:hypothetical protein